VETKTEKELQENFQKRVNREKVKQALALGLNRQIQKPKLAQLTKEEIERRFGLPETLATKYKAQLAQDDIFGGYGLMWNGLVAHAVAEGQFPMTGFVGYPALQQISQNGLIRACVQTIADDMTREWIELSGSDDQAEHITALESMLKRYKVQSLFNKAFSMVGYEGGALIFIDTGVDDDKLQQPLFVSKMSTEFDKDKPLRFVLVDPVNVSPVEYNSTDPLKEDYLLPTKWQVLGKIVHASRLIRIVDNEPPTLLRPNYNFLGIPMAQILWDYVLEWNKDRVESGELLKKLNLLVYKTDVAEAIASGGIEELDLKVAAMNRYRSNDAVVVADMNSEDLTNVTLTISGAREITQQALEFVAAINRTPAVKLLGISPSGFNATGESDIRNYYDYVRSKQEKFRDAIQTVINAIQIYEFGEIDAEISFEFAELGTDDELKRSQTGSQETTLINGLLDHNIISPEEARQYVKNSPNMGLNFIDEDEMPEPQQGQMMGAEGQGGNPLAAAMQQAQQGQEQPQQSQSAPTESLLDKIIRGGNA